MSALKIKSTKALLVVVDSSLTNNPWLPIKDLMVSNRSSEDELREWVGVGRLEESLLLPSIEINRTLFAPPHKTAREISSSLEMWVAEDGWPGKESDKSWLVCSSLLATPIQMG